MTPINVIGLYIGRVDLPQTLITCRREIFSSNYDRVESYPDSGDVTMTDSLHHNHERYCQLYKVYPLHNAFNKLSLLLPLGGWQNIVKRQSQSQCYLMTDGSPPISSSGRQVPRDSRHSNFIFQLNTCGYSRYVTSSLTRGWVCRSQLLLVSPAQSFSGQNSAGPMTIF
jgi:hypothetical protein